MKTVVLGASTNPARASNRATLLLQEMNLPVVPIGIREGEIGRESILVGVPEIADVHTLTLYIGKERQAPLLDYMLSLKPQRVIFNPGTENPTTIRAIKEAGIEAEIACTLVMLSTGQYFPDI